MNDCLILIDKPLNLTSNHVLQSMKKRLKIKKAGLVGVLDPLATGMLLIVTGEATKFSQYIETMTKEYVVAMMKQLNWTVIESRVEKTERVQNALRG